VLTSETVTIRVSQQSSATNGDFDLHVIELPEPGAALQLGSGLLALAWLVRRRSKV